MCLNQYHFHTTHALDLAKFQNNFGDGKWKLIKGSFYMVAKGVVYSTLYKTQVKLIKDGLNAVENDAFPNFRHKRLAHLCEKGLQIFFKEVFHPT